jgi:hypothetical protein
VLIAALGSEEKPVPHGHTYREQVSSLVTFSQLEYTLSHLPYNPPHGRVTLGYGPTDPPRFHTYDGVQPYIMGLACKEEHLVDYVTGLTVNTGILPHKVKISVLLGKHSTVFA